MTAGSNLRAAYVRVGPRDLFNESKLLKCMGRVALLHFEGKDDGRLRIRHIRPRLGYVIAQDRSDGSLHIANMLVTHRDGRLIRMGTVYNSKSPYPLEFECEDERGYVLEDDGSFTPEFKALLGMEKPA